MCGRFRLSRSDKEIRDRFGVAEDHFDWTPRYNIAPTQQVAVIRQDPAQPVRRMNALRWGLVPHWAQDAAIGARMINARSETAAEKPSFQDAFRRRRCILPADGFYEWKREEAGKQPYHFGLADDSLFALAGLWDRWHTPDGQILETCAILTAAANPLMAPIHDRMPCILRDEDLELWLEPSFSQLPQLSVMLAPYDPARMKAFLVSTHVNQVRNDDPECAREWRPPAA